MLRREDGVASLIGVTLTSFLILLLTISIATFMTGELQRSTDAADSIKAYYVATSSSEEAILDIKHRLAQPGTTLASLNQGCNADTVGGPARMGTPLQGLVCRQVSSNTSNLDSVASSDDTIQFDFTNAPTSANLNIDRVELSWDARDVIGTPDEKSSFVNPPSGPAALTGAAGSWGAKVPPVMEISVANYFPDQQTTIDRNTSGTVLVVPQWDCTTVACPDWTNFQLVSQAARAAAASVSPVVLAHCTANTLRCKVTLYNVAPLGYKSIVRLTPRYGPAQYNLKVYDYSGAKVAVPAKNAQIDITTQVGNSFRRVVMEIPIRSGAYPFQVLYGDLELCKDFDIVTYPGYEVVRPTPAVPGPNAVPPCPLTTF